MADGGDSIRVILKLLGAVATIWYLAERRRKKRETKALERADPEEAAFEAPESEAPVFAAEAEQVQDPVEEWIDLIRVGEDDTTRRAEFALEALGADATDALRRAQHDHSLYVRESADRVLGRIRRAERREVEPLVTEEPPDPQPTVIEFEPKPKTEPESVPEPEPEAPPAPPVEEAVLPCADLTHLLQQAVASGDRDALLADLEGRRADLRFTLGKRERTSAYDASPSHRDGRTLIGTLDGTELPVAVRSATSDVAWADALEIGMSLDLDVRYARWDRIYDRATFEARGVRP